MNDADFSDYQAHLGHDDAVVIRKSGVVVATARWNGRTLEGCSPPLHPASGTGAFLVDVLAAQIDAEVTAAWQSLPPACDEQGIDLTLLDWMLSLSPSERLAMLQDAADSFPITEGGDDPLS